MTHLSLATKNHPTNQRNVALKNIDMHYQSGHIKHYYNQNKNLQRKYILLSVIIYINPHKEVKVLEDR